MSEPLQPLQIARNGTFTYIGRAACGCVQKAIVDDRRYRQDVTDLLEAMVRDDLIIDRVDTETVRMMTWTCDEHKKNKGVGR